METKQIFAVLGIPETREEERIRNAYLGRLVGVNPEDNPEGFRRLREAYEAALSYARQREDADAAPKDDPISLFLGRAEEIYRSLPRRLDPKEWEALARAEILDDLDLGEQAKWELFSFLSDSWRLPAIVWRTLDKSFGICENPGEFKEHLPENFVDHMLYKCSAEGEDGEFPYRSLTGDKEADYDGFLQQYDELVSLMRREDGQPQEDWQRALEQKVAFLDTFGIGHPWYDLEKARCSLLCGRKEEALERISCLWESDRADNRIRVEGARILLDCGREEEAAQIWEPLLERKDLSSSERYWASLGLARIRERNGAFWEARRYALQAVKLYDTEEAHELLVRIDTKLIDIYTKEDAPALSREEVILLAWCFNQTKRDEEGWVFFEENGLLDGEEKECCRAKAVLAANAGRGRQAVEEARRWRAGILREEEAGKERENAIAQSFYLEGKGYILLNREQEETDSQKAQEMAQRALDALEEAVRRAPEKREVLMSEMLFYRTLERYEDMAQLCGRLREMDPSDYWAYFYGQEAYEKLGRAQEVVDSYFEARKIYAGHAEIYERAVKVFLHYRQYGDAQDILDQAQEAGVSSFLLTARRAELLQKTARDEAAVKEADAFLEKAMAEFEEKEAPDDLKAELYLRRALLHSETEEKTVSEDSICEWFTRSVQLKDSALARYYLGRYYVEDRNDRKTAYEHLKAAEAQGMTFSWLFYYIARCEEAFAHWDDAIAYYKKAAREDPDEADFPWRISWLYRNKFRRTGQPEYYREAEEWLNLQEEKFGLTGMNLWQRSLLSCCAMRYEEALEQIDGALEEYHPDYVWGDRGLILDLLDRPEEAFKSYEKGIAQALREGEDYGYGYDRIRRFFFQKKDYEGGLRWFMERQPLLKTKEQRRSNLDHIRKFYLRLGDLGKALAAVEESYGSADLSAHACASWKEEGGRIEDILDSYEECATLEELAAQTVRAEALMEGPGADALADSECRGRAWGEIAFVYTNFLMDDEKGFCCLQKAPEYAVKEGDAEFARQKLDHLIRCSWRRGDLEQAAAYAKQWWENLEEKYEECAALGRTVRQLHAAGNCPRRNLYDFFWLHFFTGDYDGARDYLQQMENAPWCWDCERKDCTELWECKGYLLLWEGDRQQAREAFLRAQEASLYGNTDAQRELRRLDPAALEKN